jgi:hypothetical protein
MQGSGLPAQKRCASIERLQRVHSLFWGRQCLDGGMGKAESRIEKDRVPQSAKEVWSVRTARTFEAESREAIEAASSAAEQLRAVVRSIRSV